MTLIDNPFTTAERVERRFSSAGVVAFSDHDHDGYSDDGVVDDAINYATSQLSLYMAQRYDVAALATHDLVIQWATDIAVCYLCSERGNPVPDSVQLKCDKILDPDDGLASRVGKGLLQIPGLALKADLRPSWSNLQVDRRYWRSKTRVTTQNSSDSPTTLSQDRKQDLNSGVYGQ